MGYAGGLKDAPTYHDMGDHTEAVQVDYDPRIISYKALLSIFWDSHEPAARSFSRQYMRAVFYHNEEQKKAALASKSGVERKIGRSTTTAVVPIRSYTMAENYHQKYTLKAHRRLNNEMMKLYPHPDDFVNSTAVTRLNGYIGGYGSGKQLVLEENSLGLSTYGKNELRRVVSGQ